MEAAPTKASLDHLTEEPPSTYQRSGKSSGKAFRRPIYTVLRMSVAHDILNLRVSPWGAVFTRKFRIINELSFEAQTDTIKGKAERRHRLRRCASVPLCGSAAEIPHRTCQPSQDIAEQSCTNEQGRRVRRPPERENRTQTRPTTYVTPSGIRG